MRKETYATSFSKMFFSKRFILFCTSHSLIFTIFSILKFIVFARFEITRYTNLQYNNKRILTHYTLSIQRFILQTFPEYTKVTEGARERGARQQVTQVSKISKDLIKDLFHQTVRALTRILRIYYYSWFEIN